MASQTVSLAVYLRLPFLKQRMAYSGSFLDLGFMSSPPGNSRYLQAQQCPMMTPR